jgi:hypothetical protein
MPATEGASFVNGCGNRGGTEKPQIDSNGRKCVYIEIILKILRFFQLIQY